MPPSPSSSSTTTTTQTPTDLESDLLSHLATTHALEDLHTTLLSTLQRLGWTEKIRRLSTELLRANRCERFDDVVEAVVASAQGRPHPFLSDSDTNTNTNTDSNANANANTSAGNRVNHSHNSNGEVEAVEGSSYSFENADVRIPGVVVEQGVRAIKDVLKEVVVLEDEGDGVGGSNNNGSGTGAGTSSNIAVEVVGEKRPGEKPVNGDTSPTKKGDKKTKQGKTAK